MANTFRKSVRKLNQEQMNQDASALFSSEQKNALFKQTKMYIFLQELLESVKGELEAEEEIQSYFPLTTDGPNLSFMNVGYLGIYHPKTEKGRKYIKDFHDLRGNRLLIFTDQRIIFLTIIEYIDQGLFYSYPYEAISVITVKKMKSSYWEREGGFRFIRKKLISYYFDFECENSIFSELIDEADAQLFLEQISEIDKMKNISIRESVYRKRKFDFLINNFQMGLRIGIFLSYSMIVLFILFFLLGVVFHIGPWADLIPKY
ncbi:hypothetical protein LI951_01670 [Enterococcus sp. BWT-B8]|uniref:hypothetical protein n=1 Tax=unclassified Enterococcus TaxID=2608891 RepID=UPI001E3B7678|nr:MULTISPECIES: hypothetical protein [unclassified Enterococcus]MCB5950771.1 hypothetical protein [Enterococcus sp. BWT-B8]MCB5955212.1 hypothetical protein [Enterococcus sp. CWB-B31]